MRTRKKHQQTWLMEPGRSRRLVGKEVQVGRYLMVLEKIGTEWKILQHFSMNVM
jgi:hypothetical protein